MIKTVRQLGQFVAVRLRSAALQPAIPIQRKLPSQERQYNSSTEMTSFFPPNLKRAHPFDNCVRGILTGFSIMIPDGLTGNRSKRLVLRSPCITVARALATAGYGVDTIWRGGVDLPLSKFTGRFEKLRRKETRLKTRFSR